jgi:hypothetical protein
VYVSLGSASLMLRRGQHGGIARSGDGGRTWEKVETDYTRATIVPPARLDLLLAGQRQVGRVRLTTYRDTPDQPGDSTAIRRPSSSVTMVPSSAHA